MSFTKLGQVAKAAHLPSMTIRSKQVRLKFEEIPERKKRNPQARGNREVCLEVVLTEEDEVLITPEDRKIHSSTVNPELDRLFEKTRFASEGGSIANDDYPLEVLSAWVRPILRLQGEIEENREESMLVIASFLPSPEDLPEGFVISGGTPQSLGDLLNPHLTARRHGVEELLIGDNSGRFFAVGDKETVQQRLAAWEITPKEIINLEFEKTHLRQGDAHSLEIINLNGERHRTADVDVYLDKEKGSIHVVENWIIKLPIPLEDLKLWDGKQKSDGSPLQRLVRLTTPRGGETERLFLHGTLVGGWAPGIMNRLATTRDMIQPDQLVT